MGAKYYQPSDGTTGRIFEDEILGRCFVSWNGYMKWEDARSFAQQNQPWEDPENPDCPIARHLLHNVREKLGGKVLFFTAIGTPFDVYHGVDGWFEFRGKIVTIDVTKNPFKVSCKADVLLKDEHLGSDDFIVPEIADQVAYLLSR